MNLLITRSCFTLHILIYLTFTAMQAQDKASTIKYPFTKQSKHIDTYFGTVVADPYQWFEDDNSKETKAWVKEQNQVTNAYLNKIPFRENVRKRLLDLYNYERVSTPYKKGDYVFFSKNDGLQNQSITYYKKADKGKEIIFLDPNSLSKEGTVSAKISSFSKDKKYAAIVVNKAGSDWSEIWIKDVKKNTFTKDVVQKVKFSGAAWYKDGFFYSRFPKAEKSELSDKNENHSIYYHKLGTPQSKDVLIYKDAKNPLLYHFLYLTENQDYFVLGIASGTYGNKLWIAKATDDFKNIKWKKVLNDFSSESQLITYKNGNFFLHTDLQSPQKKLVSFTLDKPDPKHWKTVINEKKHLLSTVTKGGGFLFLHYLENANSKVYKVDYQGVNLKEIAFPELGSALGFFGEDKDKELYYTFNNFTQPTTIYKYDLEKERSEVYFKPKLTFDSDAFITRQLWTKSKDGTKIPYFIVHKKTLEKNGKNPTYLYAYGGFNVNLTPNFNPLNIWLLEQGGVLVIANLRGGGEFGAKWHEQGMKMNKQNVFDDFYAVAQELIDQKYTSSDYLAIAGGSNGGLLVGAAITQKPELFKVAFPMVGVMDMLKFHKFTVGWGWVSEYGSSEQNPQMFAYLKNYSPLHNVKKGGKYPATLIITADHDDRVVPAHSFKFAAEIQQKNASKNPTLIRIETQAGHGAGKPIHKIVDEKTDLWSFMFYNMGLKVN